MSLTWSKEEVFEKVVSRAAKSGLGLGKTNKEYYYWTETQHKGRHSELLLITVHKREKVAGKSTNKAIDKATDKVCLEIEVNKDPTKIDNSFRIHKKYSSCTEAKKATTILINMGFKLQG